MSRRVRTAFPLNAESFREGVGSITYDDAITFGEFRLLPAERRIERDGVPLRIGGRALDILTVLVSRAPEIVDKRDLMARVWPNFTIDEGSLRFHVNALRKVLGEDGKERRPLVRSSSEFDDSYEADQEGSSDE
jgi:DNA-binding response OmpR family regulator